MAIEPQRLKGFTSLHECVLDYKAQINDFGMGNYRRYMSFAERALSWMNITSIRNVNVAYLTPDENNVIAVPDDCAQISKLGININGRLHIIGRNENIVLPRDITCGEEYRDVYASNSNIVTHVNYFPHFHMGALVTNLFGMSGGFNLAYYRYDTTSNTIIIEGDVSNYDVVLEYISSGVEASPQSAVPLYLREPIIAFIDWKVVAGNPTSTRGDIQDKMSIFGTYYHQARDVKYRFNLQELLDAINRGARQSIKRL